jgi:hypothetical protein
MGSLPISSIPGASAPGYSDSRMYLFRGFSPLPDGGLKPAQKRAYRGIHNPALKRAEQCMNTAATFHLDSIRKLCAST